MLQYHLLNPETFEEKGQTWLLEDHGESLVEFRFMHSDQEMLYQLPEFADQHDFLSPGPETPLNDVEEYMWIHKILFNEISHDIQVARQSKHLVEPLTKDNWKIIRNHHFSWYKGNSNIPVSKMQEVIEEMDIKPHKYRMYLTIIWNETVQQFNVLRHGDTCRIRFVYTHNLEWYQNHLAEFKRQYSM